MARKKRRSTHSTPASAGAGRATERYVLKLYVTGATVRSLRAIANIKAICEQYLKGRYRLEVVDVYRRPALLSKDQIVAVPTLVKKLPVPLRLLVGEQLTFGGESEAFVVIPAAHIGQPGAPERIGLQNGVQSGAQLLELHRPDAVRITWRPLCRRSQALHRGSRSPRQALPR